MDVRQIKWIVVLCIFNLCNNIFDYLFKSYCDLKDRLQDNEISEFSQVNSGSYPPGLAVSLSPSINWSADLLYSGKGKLWCNKWFFIWPQASCHVKSYEWVGGGGPYYAVYSLQNLPHQWFIPLAMLIDAAVLIKWGSVHKRNTDAHILLATSNWLDAIDCPLHHEKLRTMFENNYYRPHNAAIECVKRVCGGVLQVQWKVLNTPCR